MPRLRHAPHRLFPESGQPFLTSGQAAVPQFVGAVPCNGDRLDIQLLQILYVLQPSRQRRAALHRQDRRAPPALQHRFQLPAGADNLHAVGIQRRLIVRKKQHVPALLKRRLTPQGVRHPYCERLSPLRISPAAFQVDMQPVPVQIHIAFAAFVQRIAVHVK